MAKEFGAPGDPDEFTPVRDVLEQIRDPEARKVVALLWEHSANQEMRARKQLEQTEGGSLRRDIEALGRDHDRLCEWTSDELTALNKAIVDIRGEGGNNGKLGALKDRVDKTDSRRWWLITFLVGTIITIVTAGIAIGRWMGNVESDLETLKARAQRRSAPAPFSQPAEMPGKDIQ